MLRIQFGTKKSVGEYVYGPLHLGGEPGCSKDCHFQNIKLYGKVDSLFWGGGLGGSKYYHFQKIKRYENGKVDLL